jgi:hypothetical protein
MGLSQAAVMGAATAAFAIALATTPAEAQRAQRLPAQMPIENLRAANVTEFAIVDQEGKVIGRLARPLAAGKKASVRLQRGANCELTVRATFDDEAEIDETVNLCREKVIRLRD